MLSTVNTSLFSISELYVKKIDENGMYLHAICLTSIARGLCTHAWKIERGGGGKIKVNYQYFLFYLFMYIDRLLTIVFTSKRAGYTEHNNNDFVFSFDRSPWMESHKTRCHLNDNYPNFDN